MGEDRALPWDVEGTVFACAWEYPVADIQREVEFHTRVLGMSTLADDGAYALFTNEGGEITYACRRVDGARPDLAAHRLTLMTRHIDDMAEALLGRAQVTSFMGSPVQRVLRLNTPAGLDVDIWEDPDDPSSDAAGS